MLLQGLAALGRRVTSIHDVLLEWANEVLCQLWDEGSKQRDFRKRQSRPRLHPLCLKAQVGPHVFFDLRGFGRGGRG